MVCLFDTGPRATNILDAVGLVRSDVQDPGDPNPDISIINLCSLYGAGEKPRFKDITGMKDEVGVR